MPLENWNFIHPQHTFISKFLYWLWQHVSVSVHHHQAILYKMSANNYRTKEVTALSPTNVMCFSENVSDAEVRCNNHETKSVPHKNEYFILL
jgi:hypothetical protein